ncbi:MAG: HAD-IA family hydrolase [Desulfobacterales bacterium]|jgi:HAD superfamily hydrolase (TIGR01509 family)
MTPKPYTVKAVLFDFDGTLTRPGAIDFARIRKAIGCPPERTILEYIAELPDKGRREEAMNSLHRMEMAAARASVPNEDAEAIIAHLKGIGLPVGILTRNSREAVAGALSRFSGLSLQDFDLVITRDDPVAPKPSPDGVLQAAGRFGVEPSEVLVVGDFRLDIEAGRRAGALTAELVAPGHQPTAEASFVLERLSELKAIFRGGRPLPPGKFPSDLLEEFFGRLSRVDPLVLVQPSVGEDTAAIDISGEDTVILTSDPITFVSDQIATYAVLINANDIATAGAMPRWLLTTLLFPPGTTPSAIRSVMNDIRDACDRWQVSLCGGHTEITDAVTRPVVTGMMVGTVARSGLIDKRSMRSGDAVLLSKGVSVEGTAIIAREFSGRLSTLGMDEEEIRRGQSFLDKLSILEEAHLAIASGGVSALHDVTEGGLATALSELSVAGGHRLRIRVDHIPIFPQTQRVCSLLGIDPLGLIGSGSLLICCRPEKAEAIMRAVAEAGIDVTRIGEVLEAGNGIEARLGQTPVPWPRFEVDEITRLFQG